MLWKVTCGLVMLCIVLALVSKADTLTIESISKTVQKADDTSGAVDEIVICVDEELQESRYHLLIIGVLDDGGDTESEVDYNGQFITSGTKKCLQFGTPLNSGIDVEKERQFRLEVLDEAGGNVLDGAVVQLKIPDFSGVAGVNAYKVGDGNSLRITGVKEGTKITLESSSVRAQQIVTSVCGGSDEVCFAIEVQASIYDTAGVCEDVPDTLNSPATVAVCADNTELQSITATASVDDVTLFYEGKIEISGTSTASPTHYDIIAYEEGYNGIGDSPPTPIICKATPASPLPLSCSAAYTPADATLKILMIGYDAAALEIPVDSALVSLKDYNVKQAAVNSDSLEAHWTRDDATPHDKYRVTLNDCSTDSSFTQADVTCTDLSYCYAYFLKVTTPTGCSVTVQPLDDSDDPVNTNKIRTSPLAKVQYDSQLRRALHIETVHLDWKPDAITTNASVCIRYESRGNETDTFLTTNEVVLVNNKGHWLRSTGGSRSGRNRFCFLPLTLEVKDFDVSDRITIIALRRNKDTLDILASGEATLSFTIPKALELDSNLVQLRWFNPDHQNFTVRSPLLSDSQVTQTSCNPCSVYVHPEGHDDSDRVVTVETVEKEVKVTSSMSLESGSLKGDLPPRFVISAIAQVISVEGNGNNDAMIRVTTTDNIENIADVIISLIKKNDDETGQEHILMSTKKDSLVAPTDDVFFTLPPEKFIEEDKPMAVVAAAHNTAGGVVADGIAYLLFKSITPAVSPVGVDPSPPAPSPLRVETEDFEITVNGNVCPQNNVCYFLKNEDFQDPLELCREAGTNTDGASTAISQCDITQPFGDFIEMTDIEAVTLEYTEGADPKMLVAAAFTPESKTLEILPYLDEDDMKNGTVASCTVAGEHPTCETGSLSLPGTEFNLLLVALDEGAAPPLAKLKAVQESTTIKFEDFQVKSQQLTADAIEVRWQTSAVQGFVIDLEGKVGENGFSSTKVECGDPDSKNCKAYFIFLNGPGEFYTVTVKKDASEEFKSVSNTFIISLPAVEEKLKVLSVSLTTLNGNTNVGICFTSDGDFQSGNYSLVLVDIKGKAATHTENFQLTEGDYCFSDLTLDPSFDVTESVRILMTAVTDDDSGGEKPLPTAGDLDLYLLTSNSPALSMHQAGQKTLMIKWQNKNNADRFLLKVDNEDQLTLECSEVECTRYIHLKKAYLGPLSVTLTEEVMEITQELKMVIDMAAPEDLTISTHTILWNDRVKACFQQPPGASRYEFGLERGNTFLEAAVDPDQETEHGGLLCVISNEPVSFGAFVELWMLITAYSDGGVIIASGEQNWQSIFLSSNRIVRAATTNGRLYTSWHILDGADGIDTFQVTLRSAEDQEEPPVSVPARVSSHAFLELTEGSYSVCVAAVVNKPSIVSELTCSYIVFVNNKPDVVAPPVETQKSTSTSENTVLVTWIPPVDDAVTSFIVSWSKKVKISPKFYGVHVPISLTKIHTTSEGNPNFEIVPASTTSYEIEGLNGEDTYDTCVASIKEDVGGETKCNDVTTADYTEVPQPQHLQYDAGQLTWTLQEDIESYVVEWVSHSGKKGGSQEIPKGTAEVDLSPLEPGSWTANVRAVKGSSSSDASFITITINGIEIEWSQIGKTSVAVKWNEEPAPTEETEYTVTLSSGPTRLNPPIKIKCIPAQDQCGATLMDLEVASTDQVWLQVQKDSSTKSSVQLQFKSFTEVLAYTQRVISDSNITVSWNEVVGAKVYNLSLYTANYTTLRLIHVQAYPLSYDLTFDDMFGNVFLVQPCSDKTHCGDPAVVVLSDNVYTPPDDTAVIVLSVLGGVMGVAIIIYIIVVAVKKKQAKKSTSMSIQRHRLEEAATATTGAQQYYQEQMPPAAPVYNEWGARPLGRNPTIALDDLRRKPQRSMY